MTSSLSLLRRSFLSSTKVSQVFCLRGCATDPEQGHSVEDKKAKILNTSLLHVPRLGWTEKSIIEGASELGYSTSTHGMFPRGGTDLALHFYKSSNKNLFEKLSQELKEVEEEVEGKVKKSTGKFVRDALEDRIRMTTVHRSNWHEAMALLAHPSAAGEALGLLGNLVDDIWFLAGDKSHDFNWYTKRASLAFIYKTAELYMLEDKSEDFAETWKFLDRRFEDVGFVGNTMSMTSDLAQGLVNGGFKSAYTVLRNMAGVRAR